MIHFKAKNRTAMNIYQKLNSYYISIFCYHQWNNHEAFRLQELITTNDEEYINLAVNMAKDKETLKKLKLKLKNNKLSKLLFNTKK